MKAISLWQPWASAMASGAKRIETRSWRFPEALIGQPLAIHASKKDPRSVVGPWMSHYCVSAGVDHYRAIHVIRPERALPYGKIVAVVRVIACLPVEEISAEMLDVTRIQSRPYFGGEFRYGLSERQLGNYEPGRFGWVTELILPLTKPVECVGRQRIFNLSDEAEAAVTDAMKLWEVA